MDSHLADALASLAVANDFPEKSEFVLGVGSEREIGDNPEDVIHWEERPRHIPVSADVVECKKGLDVRYELPHSLGGKYIGKKELRQLYLLANSYVLGNLIGFTRGISPAQRGLRVFPKGSCFYNPAEASIGRERYILIRDFTQFGGRDIYARPFANNPCELSINDYDQAWSIPYNSTSAPILPLELNTGIYPLLSLKVDSPQFVSFDGTITAMCKFPSIYHMASPLILTGSLCGKGRCQIIASSYSDLATNEEHQDSYMVLTTLYGTEEEDMYGIDEAAPLHMSFMPMAPNQTMYIYAYYQEGRPDIRFCEIRPPHLWGDYNKWDNVTFTKLGGMGVTAIPQWPSIKNK